MGPWLYDALAVADALRAEGIQITVIDARFVKPLDTDLLSKFSHIKEWITLEDHSITGGLGGAVAEWITSNGLAIRLQPLGIPDVFVEHGSIDDLRNQCGCGRAGIRQAVIDALMRQTVKSMSV